MWGCVFCVQVCRVMAEIQTRAAMVLALYMRSVEFSKLFIAQCGACVHTLKILGKDCSPGICWLADATQQKHLIFSHKHLYILMSFRYLFKTLMRLSAILIAHYLMTLQWLTDREVRVHCKLWDVKSGWLTAMSEYTVSCEMLDLFIAVLRLLDLMAWKYDNMIINIFSPLIWVFLWCQSLHVINMFTLATDGMLWFSILSNSFSHEQTAFKYITC